MRPSLLLVLVAATASAAPLPATVAPRAQLFELDQVRLLDGPFKVAQETDADYMLKLDPDRFMSWFRKNAGLAPKGEVYGGWESKGVAGQSCGHYLSALSQMYAATGNAEFKRRAEYMVSEYATCQQAGGDGYVAAIPDGRAIFAKIKSGIIDTPNEGTLDGGWVPWYVIHKELAGLLDVYHYCGDAQALDVAKKLADWIGDIVGGLNHDQMQRMLNVEQGGMTEALANLYGVTGDTRYLDLAEKFRHDKVFLPLSQGRDTLNGLHANTQIPKFIGYQRVYELDGDETWHAAAVNFWKTVTQNRSFVTGGDGEHEHFFPVERFEQQMADTVGPESCNSYNMLKLTEHIFQYEPDASVMDYYERTLFNHILATIRPHQDGFIYYTSLSPGSYRTYSTDFNSFWCCVDTGMENHAKYGRMIYAHEGSDKLLVNLFIASTLNWPEAGLRLEQKTTFPEEPATTLVLHPAAPRRFEIDLRYPAWVAPGALKISVNGEPQPVRAQPGQYAAVTREWKDGDTVRVETPMALHTEMLPHSNDYVAVLYGPLVLAGKLGLEGLTPADFTAQCMNPAKRLPVGETSVITQAVGDIPAHLQPDPIAPLTFDAKGLVQPRDVRFVPIYKLYNERYTVYWRLVHPGDLPKEQADLVAQQAAQQRMDQHTLDAVTPEQQPEIDHHMAGEKTRHGTTADGVPWRDANAGGWFSYQLHVDPTQPLELACKYWGGEVGARQFDVLVDGQVVGSENLHQNRPGEFFYAAYPLPAALLAGKTSVTVKFQAHPANMAGGIFDCRIIKAGTVASLQAQ